MALGVPPLRAEPTALGLPGRKPHTECHPAGGSHVAQASAIGLGRDSERSDQALGRIVAQHVIVRYGLEVVLERARKMASVRCTGMLP